MPRHRRPRRPLPGLRRTPARLPRPLELTAPTGAATVTDRGHRRALNADAAPPVPQLRSLRPHTPGRLLLCTDGLWRYLPTPGALRTVLPSPTPTTSLADARALVDHALTAGGRDNVTALLVPLHPTTPA